MKGRELRYVVVEGPIGVGKTTLAARLAESLRGELLREGAEENPFLAKYYRDPRSYALSTQLFFLMQRSRQMQELRQADMFAPLCVADFMIEKDRLFARMILDDDELNLYEQIYTHLTMDAPTPDLVIYLQAPVEVLLGRISGRGREYERTIESEYLERLSREYMHFFYNYADAPLLMVNAEEINLASGERDYNRLLEKIRSIDGGRHYFNPSPD